MSATFSEEEAPSVPGCSTFEAEAVCRRRDSTLRSGTCRTTLDDVMLGVPGERNLLFGIAALRMNLISHAALLEATREWVRDDSRTLGQVLVARNALDDDEIGADRCSGRAAPEESGDDTERGLARLAPGRRAAVCRVPAPPRGVTVSRGWDRHLTPQESTIGRRSAIRPGTGV